MAGPQQDDDDAAMRARLSALSKDLAKGGQPAAGTPSSKGAGDGSALNLGVRVASEFVGAILVGAFIGWEIDRWLHSSPAALIVFIALGTAAAFYSVYRIATKSGGR